MCNFRTHGFCSRPCTNCDTRMLNAQERIARKAQAQASMLMRSKPNAR